MNSVLIPKTTDSKCREFIMTDAPCAYITCGDVTIYIDQTTSVVMVDMWHESAPDGEEIPINMWQTKEYIAPPKANSQ